MDSYLNNTWSPAWPANNISTQFDDALWEPMQESNSGVYSSDSGFFASTYVDSSSELNHSLDDPWSSALPPAISPSISPSTLFDDDTKAAGPWSPARTESIGSQASSPVSSGGDSEGSSSARAIKMRGARRDRVRKQQPPPALPGTQQKARDSHNLVEKKYRNRLNQEFELLLTTLTRRGSESGSDGGSGIDEGRAFTKTAVLKLARQTLLDLEERNRVLRTEIKTLGEFS
ncbi:hypothetical protein NKR19_g5570 [Coniochaeta hoffmannii]|uniref:BHLH domain-containing protein n=1 Tax=Coniochaeta hoffmannii TaxID=91930 RepID=A0AA38S5D5_9PEZI|nr:hypothetical protein NKR19_g5570 [Coniochaeta hoffmannii]